MKKLYMKPETACTFLYLGDCLMLNGSVGKKNGSHDSYLGEGYDLPEDTKDGVATAKSFNSWDDWD